MSVDEILGARERLEFEHLLQWLRLSFLLTPVLVLLAFGAAAVPYALLIAAAVALSFCWVGLLTRYRPRLLLRMQLLLRVLDCGVVYLVLVNYHAFLHNAYYDSVYLLFVVAAAATHARLGAWTLSVVAAIAVLLSRLQLILEGAMAFEPRHVTDALFYALFFLLTSSAVAFLMHRTAQVVATRERALSAQIAERNLELERTANELAESIRLRDNMLAGVTHDLRTPVTVIKVQAQLLRRRANEQLRSSIDQIERAATRMARWIDELLEVASVHSADEIDLTLSETDLVSIVRDAIAEYEPHTRRHSFRVEAEPDEVVSEFDASRLERVIDNLIGNAIKYTPQGGCVQVDVRASGGWASVSVSDEGIGIPPEDLPYIFEPFRRGANVVGRISGTGIGLASAKRIVERHGGTLSASSKPGQGSTFMLRLPLRG